MLISRPDPSSNATGPTVFVPGRGSATTQSPRTNNRSNIGRRTRPKRSRQRSRPTTTSQGAAASFPRLRRDPACTPTDPNRVSDDDQRARHGPESILRAAVAVCWNCDVGHAWPSDRRSRAHLANVLAYRLPAQAISGAKLPAKQHAAGPRGALHFSRRELGQTRSGSFLFPSPRTEPGYAGVSAGTTRTERLAPCEA